MADDSPLRAVLSNLLEYSDLSFRDFVELALYHPQHGYYSQPLSPIGKEADYVTASHLSPAFSFAISELSREFASRVEAGMYSFVDIGCGDGRLIRELAPAPDGVRLVGVDRSLERAAAAGGAGEFVDSIDRVPRDTAAILFSNELFDAFPFARLVNRGEHVHELWVREGEAGALEWSEHEAPAPYEDYFAARGIELQDGQFADVSLEWEEYYGDLARLVPRSMIVTIDYGFLEQKLFHPRARRFGTAAAYSRQRVTRDLLANPGRQDLTAHINFSDLQRAGEREGHHTLFFGSLARFLLGIGITRHELFRPSDELSIENLEAGLALREAREDARRLVLPDGIGEELRVMVQVRDLPLDGWSFQKQPIP